jgi:hypothetical protein
MTRGGQRKGAGRKPSPDKKKGYSTKLRSLCNGFNNKRRTIGHI